MESMDGGNGGSEPPGAPNVRAARRWDVRYVLPGERPGHHVACSHVVRADDAEQAVRRFLLFAALAGMEIEGAPYALPLGV